MGTSTVWKNWLGTRLRLICHLIGPVFITEGTIQVDAAVIIRLLREFIRSRRAALYGFMEQGAALEHVRYLNDNRTVIAELATEFYRRPFAVQCGGADAAAGMLAI